MLVIEGLRKSYRPDQPLLRDVNFRLEKGQMAVLAGASGVGKSTVLRMIYLEERPDSGRIWFNGIDLSGVRRSKVPAIRRQIGVIFQDFKLIPERTAWENVALALEIVGKSKQEIAARVTELLRTVGLLHRKAYYPHQLSGGEKQRVAVARAIANHPLLLLADEPTGNLDRDNALSLMQLLAEINLQGCSVLMATHSPEIVAGFPYRKLFLKNGIVVENNANPC